MRPFASAIALFTLLLLCCTSPPTAVRGPETATPPRPANCVNLNTATAEELKALPEIGEVLARRMIEYRERHGGFRRPQDLIVIEGFSEKRYRAIAGLICVE